MFQGRSLELLSEFSPADGAGVSSRTPQPLVWDEPHMVAKLEAACKEHEAWCLKIVEYCEEISWLEI